MDLNVKNLAKKIRVDALRMIRDAGSSHVGSNFSIADILSVLYVNFLRITPENPHWDLRDRFFLSKGHATAVLYSLLANVGFFDKKLLDTFYKKGSLLLGHAHRKVPGVELSTGSLGHALNVASGVALAAKKQGRNYKSVVLLSDGELDEGSNWEAILFAAHHQLGNLYIVIDYNKIQSLDKVENTIGLDPLKAKFEAFNCEVLECDGHNCNDIEDKLKLFCKNKPHVLIANTIKGRGVSFMENSVLWHYRCPQGDEYELALKELEK